MVIHLILRCTFAPAKKSNYNEAYYRIQETLWNRKRDRA